MAQLHRSVAALRICGDELDPDEISRLLGGVPTLSYRKGDVKKSKIKDLVRKSGAWMLEATDHEPENLNVQVDEILRQLTQDLTVWKSLSNVYKIDLFCGFFMKHTDEGVEVSAKTLIALGERGIKLGFCIYAPLKDVEADDPCPCNSGKKYAECCAPKNVAKK
jgi:Domain of unknown function (DUF4279)/SEC-C motif